MICHFSCAKTGTSCSRAMIFARAAQMAHSKNVLIRLVVTMIDGLKEVWCSRHIIKVFKDSASVGVRNDIMTLVDEFFMLGQRISDETNEHSTALESGFVNQLHASFFLPLSLPRILVFSTEFVTKSKVTGEYSSSSINFKF